MSVCTGRGIPAGGTAAQQPAPTARSRPGAIVGLLVGIPTLAVLLSTIGLVLAAGGAGDLVRDDYYKAGRIVQHDLTAEVQARQLGLGAVIEVRGNAIELRSEQVLPSSMHLTLVHPAWARHDADVTLERVFAPVAMAVPVSGPGSGSVSGSGSMARWSGTLVTPLPSARWVVILTAEGARWRLRGEARLPGQAAIGSAAASAATPGAGLPAAAERSPRVGTGGSA